MTKCINYDLYDKSNFYLFGLCFLLKSFIFLKVNLDNNNLNNKKRAGELIDCLISDQFFEYDKNENKISFNNSIKYLYSSVVCVSFNKNDLLKSKKKVNIFIGGSNIKLSRPEYYYNKYFILINKFRKNLDIYDKKGVTMKNLNKKDEKIISMYLLSESIEFILNKGDVSLKDYNKNIFSGTKCLYNGDIVSRNIEKFCSYKSYFKYGIKYYKYKKCPQKYKLINKKTGLVYEYESQGILNIEDRLNNYSEQYDERLCCKDKNDAEIDLLLSILRNNFKGDNLYDKHNNLINFLDQELLNQKSENFLGNYGFFCLDKFNNPMTPCWICNKWLSYYGCNFFNCGQGIKNEVLICKIRLDNWIPKYRYYRIINILKSNQNIKLITSMCYLGSNINQKILKKYNKLQRKKYIKGSFIIGNIIEFLKERKFRFTEWKYLEALKLFGIEIGNVNQEVFILETDNHNNVLNKFINYNKKIYKLLLCK